MARTEPPDDDMGEMARSVLGDVIGMPSMDAEKATYEAYRKVEDLPPIVKSFYSAAGEPKFHSSHPGGVLFGS